MEGRLPGVELSLALVQSGEARAWMRGCLPPADCQAPFSLPELLLGEPPVFPLTEDVRRRRAELAGAAPPAGRWFPNLVLAYPGYEAYAAGPGGGDPETLARLVGLAVDWARARELAAVAVLYCSADRAALRGALRRHGFDGAAVTVRSELSLPEGGFDEYLLTLGRHRRSEVRRELARLRDAGVVTGRLPLAGWHERVVDLRMNLVRAYGGYSDRATEAARLERLRAAFGDDRLVLIGAVAEGRLIGFSLFLAHGDTWYTHWVGQEYGHPKARHLYFACTFYQAVVEAAVDRVRRLDVGVGHEQAKAARGCRLRPLEVWVRTLRAELEPAAAAAVRLLQP